MKSIWTIVAAVTSFGISSLFGIWLVPFLKKLHFQQTEREEGIDLHKGKSGTPMMGGFMFILSSIVSGAGCVVLYNALGGAPETSLLCAKVYAGIFMALAFGAIGFIDDYIKAVKKRNLGLTAVQKLVLQFLAAIAYLATIYFFGGDTKTFIPFVGMVEVGLLYYPLAAIFIVGIVNAVNLTDGIDGLNTSVTGFGAMFFLMIAALFEKAGVSIMSAAIVGGCVGFFIWNSHPAKVFMGDTGSLYLGGYMCAIAFALDMPIMLILIGLIYIVEMFSVILQVGYFKLTHGKRLFKMSPIHHHFEKCGWSEVKIVIVFSAVTLLCGVLALLITLKYTNYI